MMTLITSSNRKAGADDAERAALHKTMFSYSGKYRVEGDMFITTVDVSWNEAWNGTEQKRQYRFEGDKLLVDTTGSERVVSWQDDCRQIGVGTGQIGNSGGTCASTPISPIPVTSCSRCLQDGAGGHRLKALGFDLSFRAHPTGSSSRTRRHLQ